MPHKIIALLAVAKARATSRKVGAGMPQIGARLLPIINTPVRMPFPDVTALARKSKPYKATKRAGTQGPTHRWA